MTRQKTDEKGLSFGTALYTICIFKLKLLNLKIKIYPNPEERNIISQLRKRTEVL